MTAARIKKFNRLVDQAKIIYAQLDSNQITVAEYYKRLKPIRDAQNLLRDK